MKTTKKVVIALLAVALLIPLVIFPASANAPVNLARVETLEPRVIAPNSFGLNTSGDRLINGNTDVTIDGERWVIASGTEPERLSFEAAYAKAFPGSNWLTYRNMWFGVAFNAPVNATSVVFYQTSPAAGTGTNRRIIHTYVVEVATTASLQAGGYIGEPMAQRTIHEDSFSTTGWTIVGGTRTANASADGFEGGRIAVDISAHTTPVEFVRVRTLTTHEGAGNGSISPNITQIEVMGTVATGGGGGDTGTPPAHVPATAVPNVPNSLVVGTRALPTQANPANATHRAVTWTVQNAGTTGATINAQGQLVTTATGTVVLTATVTNGATATTNFTSNHTITIQPAGSPQTGEPMVIFAGLAVAVLAVTGMAFVAKKSRSSAV